MFEPCLIGNIPDNLTKDKARIHNGYQKNFIGKFFKRMINNHNLCQSQHIQKEEVRINTIFMSFEGTSK